MILKLHFTDKEILQALADHGYEIKSVIVKSEEPIHGSRFIERIRYEYQVTKDGVTDQYESAFQKLIKHKLLTP